MAELGSSGRGGGAVTVSAEQPTEQPLLGSVPERLSRDRFDPDERSHIEVDQDAVRATGAASLLERICPAHVYSQRSDGGLDVTYQACLECGTCLAVAPAGTLQWYYPAGGTGVSFRQG